MLRHVFIWSIVAVVAWAPDIIVGSPPEDEFERNELKKDLDIPWPTSPEYAFGSPHSPNIDFKRFDSNIYSFGVTPVKKIIAKPGKKDLKSHSNLIPLAKLQIEHSKFEIFYDQNSETMFEFFGVQWKATLVCYGCKGNEHYPEGSYFGIELHSNDPSLEGVMVQVAYLVSAKQFSNYDYTMGSSTALLTRFGSASGVKIICKLLPWSVYKLKYVDLRRKPKKYGEPEGSTYIYMHIRLNFDQKPPLDGTMEGAAAALARPSLEEELYNDLYYRGMWPRWPKYDSRKINFGVYREESYRLNIISKMDDKPTKKNLIPHKDFIPLGKIQIEYSKTQKSPILFKMFGIQWKATVVCSGCDAQGKSPKHGSSLSVELHSNDPSLEEFEVYVVYLFAKQFSEKAEMGQSMEQVNEYGTKNGVKIVCKLQWKDTKFVTPGDNDKSYILYMQIRLTLRNRGEEGLYNDLEKGITWPTSPKYDFGSKLSPSIDFGVYDPETYACYTVIKSIDTIPDKKNLKRYQHFLPLGKMRIPHSGIATFYEESREDNTLRFVMFGMLWIFTLVCYDCKVAGKEPYPEGSYVGVELHSNDPSLEGVMVQVAYLVSTKQFAKDAKMGQSTALVTEYGTKDGVHIVSRLLPWTTYKDNYVDGLEDKTYIHMQIRLTFKGDAPRECGCVIM